MDSIAIGRESGNNIGINSLVLGTTTTATGANTIVLNATGNVQTVGTSDTFYVNPIRGAASASAALIYNTTTSEITFQTSSRSIKKNIIDLTANTESLYELVPREYDSIADDTHHLGFIAEEVFDIDPNFAWTENGLPKGIEWMNIVLYLVAETKKLRDRIAVLES